LKEEVICEKGKRNVQKRKTEERAIVGKEEPKKGKGVNEADT
jgi:hypothetical protein